MHNLTQQKLCEELHISRAAYSYFETDKRVPDLETLILFAKYYHLSLDALVSFNTKEQATNSVKEEQSYQLIQHLKSKRIPIDVVLSLSKQDFDFLANYKELTKDNKDELCYLIKYKLRKQNHS